MAKNKPTKLDELIEQAADLVGELAALDADRKLTFKAFFAEALAVADVDEKRIAEVKKIIDERPGTEAIRIFLRRYSKALSEPTHPRPSADANRVLRIYGSEVLLGEATAFGIRAGELQALSVRVCFERYGEAAFGPVENRADHEKKTTTARSRLEAIHEEMRAACANVDLEYDDSYPAVLPSERARGLSKISFRRAKGISPSMGDWPQQIIADAVAAASRKSKRPREKLPRDVAA